MKFRKETLKNLSILKATSQPQKKKILTEDKFSMVILLLLNLNRVINNLKAKNWQTLIRHGFAVLMNSSTREIHLIQYYNLFHNICKFHSFITMEKSYHNICPEENKWEKNAESYEIINNRLNWYNVPTGIIGTTLYVLPKDTYDLHRSPEHHFVVIFSVKLPFSVQRQFIIHHNITCFFQNN